MIFDYLSNKPSQKLIRYLIIFCLILFIVVYPPMTILFTNSYPVSFFESQLSFSGELIKFYNSQANIELYRIANLLDYLFMISYSGILFAIGILIARRLAEESNWRKIGFAVSLLAIVAASCDASENIFILLILTDPLNFPDIWAIIHSIFAIIKFILMFTVFGWIIVSIFKIILMRKTKL